MPIIDITLYQAITGIFGEFGQVCRVSGIGELVQVDNSALRQPVQGQMDEIGADEAAASGDQDFTLR